MQAKKHFLLFGAHMSIEGGFDKALKRGESIGCTAIQIFTKSNRQWHAKPLIDADAQLFKATLKNSSIKSVIAHASYLINLASPDKSVAQKSCDALAQELDRCHALGIQALVVHPGARLDQSIESALEQVAFYLDKALSQSPNDVAILLENTAGQGSTVGSTFEELALIRKHATHKARIQFCFDTCHAFAAGYDLRTPETYSALWEHYNATIGIEHLKAIHVNDSQKGLGSRVDRHEDIGKGKLGLEAFSLLFNDPRFLDIPKVLETPKTTLEEDKKNMETLASLVRGEG